MVVVGALRLARRPTTPASGTRIGYVRVVRSPRRIIPIIVRAESEGEGQGQAKEVSVAEVTEAGTGDVRGAGVAGRGDVTAAKDLRKAATKVASTFAPRSSTASKNPAVKGSVLYTIFEVQAVLSVIVGGLLAFNVIFPSEGPTIPRLMGMWSCWMLAVPSLRARDCEAKEKDALNLLFVLIPVLNVTIPIVWKSFAGVYSADVLAMAAVYAWKFLPSEGTTSSNDQ